MIKTYFFVLMIVLLNFTTSFGQTSDIKKAELNLKILNFTKNGHLADATQVNQFDKVAISLAVTNIGNKPLKNLEVTVPLNSSIFKDIDATASNKFTSIVDNQGLKVSILEPIKTNDVLLVVLTATVIIEPQPGVITVGAQIRAKNFKTLSSNMVNITTLGRLNLTMQVRSLKQEISFFGKSLVAEPGDQVEYMITVLNSSNITIEQVVIRNQLDQGLALDFGSVRVDGYQFTGQLLSGINIRQLVGGQQTRVTFIATVTSQIPKSQLLPFFTTIKQT
jgi:uncharacterized repeat protein (TIGR01451 family)